MKLVVCGVAGFALLAAGLIADTKVKMTDLPAAVQAAVKEQTKNATLVGVSKEADKGKTLYEVETKIGGKTRDLLLDANGTVVEIEDEIELSAVPTAAQQAIQKKAAGGTIKKVEKLTKGVSISYEVALLKNGKSSEFAVNPDGSPAK